MAFYISSLYIYGPLSIPIINFKQFSSSQFGSTVENLVFVSLNFSEIPADTGPQQATQGGVEIISQFAIASSGTLPEFRDHVGGIQKAIHLLAHNIVFWRHQ